MPAWNSSGGVQREELSEKPIGVPLGLSTTTKVRARHAGAKIRRISEDVGEANLAES